MDGDPAVESELDAFSLFLPLPYRIAVIVVLGKAPFFQDLGRPLTKSCTGVWAWGVNLHYLSIIKIVSDPHHG